MRFHGSFLVFFAAVIFFGTAPVRGEDGGLFKALFGGETKISKERGTSGAKRVEINLTEQKLRAYQGNRVVLKTRISSGKNRGTPTSRFYAGWKDADHYSSLFNNAPMPWSVQVSGDIFIHGFTHVPNYPASHGCIRMPLTGGNPAKRFFNWVTPGTPITIKY